ncbi:carbohydrate porin [Shewanella fidelis]|uniref:Carbohydrate porin n=1 Tax=Shewanella fidelis TaxID=173509 RepID=A0AAW8NTV0_9GAMM|nr:carbohydrate porin [Shewanella fidelis]MDR8525680.1 carbohydrate porin [Shewanella fidelis]MDW4812810.1 carbohydrate porin [Shewanella fidelis]MDW4816558.1 carbohydrate porin [Shewanella fidelis]MDW4820278.1 carbohydrate porin [Shewanella fidelis]MDW4825275.1 carbohydrate porin [Shewanella fidelis]
MTRYSLAACIALALASNAQATSVDEELAALKARIEQLETEQQQAKEQAAKDELQAQESSVKFGGAVRTNYVYEDYNDANADRGGDFDFDLFRIDVSGNYKDLIFSAQYRWFEYMNVVQHAWVGYNFTEQQQAKIGVTQVPFGLLTYASNNYFFSSNFYLGLEDDHDLGLNYTYKGANNQFDFAFYKNDEQGGIDGFVSDRTDRYAYDVVGIRLDGEDAYDAPSDGYAAGEVNTFNARYAHTFAFNDISVELGASLQAGQLEIENGTDGDNVAAAIHSMINYDRWNVKLQVTDYKYDVDGMDVDRIVVAAYHFYDSIPAEATTYIANLAYSLPVEIGPISNLTFYNDYSLVTDKPAAMPDTFMNVTGMAISAGGLYTYVDFVVAENQPFIGGTMVGDGDTNTRFNINFGYYF